MLVGGAAVPLQLAHVVTVAMTAPTTCVYWLTASLTANGSMHIPRPVGARRARLRAGSVIAVPPESADGTGPWVRRGSGGSENPPWLNAARRAHTQLRRARFFLPSLGTKPRTLHITSRERRRGSMSEVLWREARVAVDVLSTHADSRSIGCGSGSETVSRAPLERPTLRRGFLRSMPE